MMAPHCMSLDARRAKIRQLIIKAEAAEAALLDVLSELEEVIPWGHPLAREIAHLRDAHQ